MTITPTRLGDAEVLRLAGRLDAISSPEFEKTCQQYTTSETREMVLDFEEVDYISSAGLRAILLAGKTIQAGGGRLALTGLRGAVKDVMGMAGFIGLFPIYDSVEAALESR